MSDNVQKAREALKQTEGWLVGGGAPTTTDQLGDKMLGLIKAAEFLCDELDKREKEGKGLERLRHGSTDHIV